MLLFMAPGFFDLGSIIIRLLMLLPRMKYQSNPTSSQMGWVWFMIGGMCFIPNSSDDGTSRICKILRHSLLLRDQQFYLGGTRTLTSIESVNASHPVPLIYDPYPAYNSWKWKKQNQGKFQPCLGPRGRYLDRKSPEDMMQVYKGQQAGFPAPRFGSHEALDLDGDVCTDRYSRFGAYGYDQHGGDEVPGFTRPSAVPWSDVDWDSLQSLCLERNADRYESIKTVNSSNQSPLAFDLPQTPRKSSESPVGTSDVKPFHSRSAVLIRAWNGLDWKAHHCEYLRALIMELSLHSGGEYQVYILIHVKDEEMPIFSDSETITRLRNAIPKEFRNMALFFNNKLLEAWYPKIEEHR